MLAVPNSPERHQPQDISLPRAWREDARLRGVARRMAFLSSLVSRASRAVMSRAVPVERASLVSYWSTLRVVVRGVVSRAVDSVQTHRHMLLRLGQLAAVGTIILACGASAAPTVSASQHAGVSPRATAKLLPPTGCVLSPAVARMLPVAQVLAPRQIGLQRDGNENITPCTVPGLAVPAPRGGVPLATGQVILVDLTQEWLYAYQDGQLVLASPVSSGQPDLRTPTGTFTIQQKLADTMFTSPWPVGSSYYYAPLHVNYGLLFLEGGFYIHDSPWRATYGPGSENPHLVASGKTETGSHGCVEMPTNTAARLYAWAQFGATVIIRA